MRKQQGNKTIYRYLVFILFMTTQRPKGYEALRLLYDPDRRKSSGHSDLMMYKVPVIHQLLLTSLVDQSAEGASLVA